MTSTASKIIKSTTFYATSLGIALGIGAQRYKGQDECNMLATGALLYYMFTPKTMAPITGFIAGHIIARGEIYRRQALSPPCSETFD